MYCVQLSWLAFAVLVCINEVPGAPLTLSADAASPDWQEQQRRYRTYAKWGLTLALAGTIMEGVPAVCTAIGSARVAGVSRLPITPILMPSRRPDFRATKPTALPRPAVGA
jgi:hypothetical protein